MKNISLFSMLSTGLRLDVLKFPLLLLLLLLLFLFTVWVGIENIHHWHNENQTCARSKCRVGWYGVEERKGGALARWRVKLYARNYVPMFLNLFSTMRFARTFHPHPHPVCTRLRMSAIHNCPPQPKSSSARLSHKLLCTYRSIYNRSWRTNELTESHRIRLLAVIFLQANKIRCNGKYAGIKYQYREQYHDQTSSCCFIGKR